MMDSGWMSFPQTQELVKRLDDATKHVQALILTSSVDGEQTMDKLGVMYLLLREKYTNLVHLSTLIADIDCGKEIEND